MSQNNHHENLTKAILLATNIFKNKTDKAGAPYILHCLRVMMSVDQDDPELMQIAALHDVVEDSHLTTGDLSDAGFSDRVVAAVEVLTHDKKVPYEKYIGNAIYSNKDAVKVKLADLRDNINVLRIKSALSDNDLERIRKYHKAILYLSL